MVLMWTRGDTVHNVLIHFAVLSLLFRLYDLELVDADKGLPEPDYTAMVVGPKAGSVRVRYRRRK